MAATAEDPFLENTLGPYRVEARLGAGAMGVVYRAVDTRLQRPVALKILGRAAAADGELRIRLLREARAASALDHPNIAVVFDVGEEAGHHYLAMALYSGETLQARLARGPLPVDEALRIARALLDGLAAAHAAGIVHRDVKPANVMLTSDGGLRLLDFGLAKLAPGTPFDETATREGAVLGTPAYMAPEQLRGEAVDARADLWAVGVVLYEMLTGDKPWRAPSFAALVGKVLVEPPARAPLVARAPRWVAALVEELLAKEPAARLPSAEAAIARLEGGATAAWRGRPAALAVGGLLAFAAIGVGAYFGWPTGVVTTPPAAPTAEEPAPPAPPPPAPPPAIPPPPSAQHTPPAVEEAHHDEATLGLIADAQEAFGRGDYKRARALYERAFALTGEAPLLYNIARAAIRGGERTEGATVLRRWLRDNPTSRLRPAIERELRALEEPR
jgi:serine/threonine-protein kinase